MGSLSWPVLAFGISDLWYGVCLLVPVVVFPLSAWLLLGALSLLRVHLSVWWGDSRPSGPAPAAAIPELSPAPCLVMVPAPVDDGDSLSSSTTQLLAALLSANRGHNLTLAHLARITRIAEQSLPADPAEDSPAQVQLRAQIAAARVRYRLARQEAAL